MTSSRGTALTSAERRWIRDQLSLASNRAGYLLLPARSTVGWPMTVREFCKIFGVTLCVVLTASAVTTAFPWSSQFPIPAVVAIIAGALSLTITARFVRPDRAEVPRRWHAMEAQLSPSDTATFKALIAAVRNQKAKP